MASISEEKFIAKLKEVGYKITPNTSCKWMIGHDNTKELFEWFCENISSDNYLTEEELKEYEEIEASGNALKGDDLDKECEKLFPNYEDLDGNETELLNELGSELLEEQECCRKLNILECKLSEELASINSNVKDLEEKNNRLKKEIAKAKGKCIERNSSLESACGKLGKNIKKITKYSDELNPDAQDPQFISELPLEPYLNISTAFNFHLQHYIDEFKETATIEQKSIEEWDVNLLKFFQRYEMAKLLKVEAESKRKGLQSACSCAKGILESKELLTVDLNPGIVMERVLETKRKIQYMKKELGELRILGAGADGAGAKHAGWGGWLEKIEGTVRYHALYQFQELMYLYVKLVILKRKAPLKMLKGILKILKTHCAKDIFCMMLRGEEVTRVLNMSGLVSSGAEYLISEQNDRLQRMEMMWIFKEKSDESQRIETCPLFNFLFNCHIYHLQLDKECTSTFSFLHISSSDDVSYALQTLVKSSEKWNAEIATFEGSLFQQISQLISILQSSWKKTLQLRKKVFSGSTASKAVVCPVDQIMFNNQCEKQLKKVEHKLKALKKSYAVDKMRETALVKFFRTFWITFIVHPKALQEMSARKKF